MTELIIKPEESTRAGHLFETLASLYIMIGCKREAITGLDPNSQHPLPQPKNGSTTLLKI